jgi:hypothetical protein
MGTIRKGELKMKTLSIAGIIVCLLSLISTCAYALVSREYIQWTKGEFEIPAGIKKATNVSELQPFLDSERPFTRMAAVRRLGEIEGPKAVGLLRELFAKEASTRGSHAVPLVKLEVIRTLSRIDTEQAKAALLGILKDCWQKGPNVKDKKDFGIDRDFATVIPLLLETLHRWSGEEDVFKTVEGIALSEDVKSLYAYPNGIGQRAWEVYLKGTMIRQGIVEESNSAMYLLDFMEDIAGPVGYRTLESIKKRAAAVIFESHSVAVLASLLRELEGEFGKQRLVPDPGTPLGRSLFLKRLYELRDRISYIRHLLREKAKQKNQ